MTTTKESYKITKDGNDFNTEMVDVSKFFKKENEEESKK
jgi:hypothetical protein